MKQARCKQCATVLREFLPMERVGVYLTNGTKVMLWCSSCAVEIPNDGIEIVDAPPAEGKSG